MQVGREKRLREVIFLVVEAIRHVLGRTQCPQTGNDFLLRVGNALDLEECLARVFVCRITLAIAENKRLVGIVTGKVLQVVADIDVAPSDAVVEVEGVVYLCQSLCNGGIVKRHNLVFSMGDKYGVTTGIDVGRSSVNKYLPAIRLESTVEVGLHLGSKRTNGCQRTSVGGCLATEQLELAATCVVSSQCRYIVASGGRDVEHENTGQLFLLTLKLHVLVGVGILTLLGSRFLCDRRNIVQSERLTSKLAEVTYSPINRLLGSDGERDELLAHHSVLELPFVHYTTQFSHVVLFVVYLQFYSAHVYSNVRSFTVVTPLTVLVDGVTSVTGS